MKDRIELDGVALIGRTFVEYCALFQLDDRRLHARRILDIGAGVSSFCSEARSRGFNVTAADPIYALDVDAIAAKSDADLNNILSQLPDAAHKYNWTFYRDPVELRLYRRKAREGFLADYVADRSGYVATALPKTKFQDHEFDLALASHILFLYDDLFDYEFHKQSIFELARISKHEVRIYPLTTMSGTRSLLLDQLIHDPDCSSLTFTILKGDFEFFKNANELLIIRKD